MPSELRIRKPSHRQRETDMSINGISGALKIASLVGSVLRSGGSSQQAESSVTSPAQPTIAEIGKRLSPDGLQSVEPGQFAAFARELHERGAISDAEFNDLAAIRLELELSGAAPDKPVDLIAFLQDRIARLESQYEAPEGNTQFSLAQTLDVARRRLELVQQLDAAAQHGVNAVA
ncbi:MAG: hypothetical protein MPJ50_03080 [Pirellulales bacterium]|nr:hypothetical protein [Pirellulales bacterium]